MGFPADFVQNANKVMKSVTICNLYIPSHFNPTEFAIFKQYFGG